MRSSNAARPVDVAAALGLLSTIECIDLTFFGPLVSFDIGIILSWLCPLIRRYLGRRFCYRLSDRLQFIAQCSVDAVERKLRLFDRVFSVL
jgi:hypothetical protein